MRGIVVLFLAAAGLLALALWGASLGTGRGDGAREAAGTGPRSDGPPLDSVAELGAVAGGGTRAPARSAGSPDAGSAGERAVRLVLRDGAGGRLAPAIDDLVVRAQTGLPTWFTLHPANGGLGRATSRVPLRLRPDADGWFLLTMGPAYEPAALSITVTGVGAGWIDLRAVPPGDGPPSVREVTIDRTGSLRGRILDRAGEPIADLDVAVAWSDEARPEPHVFEGWEAPDPARRGEVGGPPGRLVASATTSASGAFSFDGLARRPMHLHVRRVTRETYENRWDLLLTATPEVAPEPLRIALDRARIECEVVGSAGRSVTIEVLDAGPLSSPPRVERVAYGFRGPSRTPIRSVARKLSDVPQLERFDVPHGRHYVVTARTKDAFSAARAVTLTGPNDLARVALDVGRFDAAAEVEVRLRVDGEVQSSRHGPVAVWAEDVATGRPFEGVDVDGWFHPWGEPVRLRVPARRVRVIAEGLVTLDGHHGTVIRERTRGRAEKIALPVAGQPTRVQLDVPAAARLEVEVRGEVSAADEAHVQAAVWERSVFEEEGESIAARLTLTDTTTGVTFPLVRIGEAMMNSSAAGPHVLDFWPLGETHRSAGMPAGIFELRATQATRTPVVTTVTLRAGETARAFVDLGGD